MPDPEIDAIRAMLAARPRPADIGERRRRLDTLAFDPLDPAIRLERVDANGVPAEWTKFASPDASRALLFIHGGGYVAGSVQSHRPIATAAAEALGCPVLALDYRRAPEHRFPAAVEDVIAAYSHLLGRGIPARHIAIGGDSAGGGLTMALLIAARDRGLPLPACGWCISPWVDLTCSGASLENKAAVDPMIQKPYLQELVGVYLGDADPRSPLASPVYADLAGLPPLLIQVGSAETLLDDAVALAGRAGAADVRVTLEIWPEMIHAWPLFQYRLAAGRRAIQQAAAFMHRCQGVA